MSPVVEGRGQNLRSNGRDRPDDPGQWTTITETARARVGSVLQEKWRLVGLRSVGGMAAVYEATHVNGSRAAVKLLHPQFSADDDIRKRFLHDGYVANLIEHSGAVPVLDKEDAPDGAAFLVMDLLEGETLQARLDRRGRLPEAEALAIAYHVLDVLAAAHARGIVHRDINLSNVFITLAGEIKVLDFGIARLANKAMLGSPAFMAPEQALGGSDEVDHQTDLWAVGATLFRILTGRNVHEAVTLGEPRSSVATRPAPSLKTVLPQSTAPVTALVDRALAFTKAERWLDARDMQEAILPLLTGGGQRLPAVQPPSPLEAARALAPVGPRPRPFWPATLARIGRSLRRHLLWWPRWALLVGAIAAVVFVSWLILRRPQTSVVVPGQAAGVDLDRAPAPRRRVTVVPVSPSATEPAVRPQPPTQLAPGPPPPRPARSIETRRSRARSQYPGGGGGPARPPALTGPSRDYSSGGNAGGRAATGAVFPMFPFPFPFPFPDPCPVFRTGAHAMGD